jgi:hypothetical protein
VQLAEHNLDWCVGRYASWQRLRRTASGVGSSPLKLLSNEVLKSGSSVMRNQRSFDSPMGNLMIEWERTPGPNHRLCSASPVS